ncbi:MAG TPA: hypothetical protein DHV02_04585 [Neisseriales bacterium]|nr:hypothetical protein [Neisseriales bacterium]
MKKIILTLLMAGLSVTNSAFAAGSSSINSNLNDLNSQIQQINQDLNSKQQQKQKIDAALKNSQGAITKTKSLLDKLTQQRALNLQQLDQLATSIPKVTSATQQAQAQVASSMTNIYQQIKTIEQDQQSLLAGNDALDAERKKTYLVAILKAEQAKYMQLNKQLAQLQALNSKLQLEVERLNAKLGNTAKQHEQLLVVKDQTAQQAVQVKQQIAREKAQLSNLKQRQVELNKLLQQLALIEKQQKARQLAAKKAAAKAAARAQAEQKQAQQASVNGATKTSQPALIVAKPPGAETSVTPLETEKPIAVSDQSTAATPVVKDSPKSSGIALGKSDASIEDNSPFMARKLSKPIAGNITVGFGQMRDSVRNNGVLVSPAENTPVYSVSRGVVLFSGSLPGFGQIIVVDNGDNYTSVYSGVISKVAKGNSLAAGQQIASSGNADNQPMGGVYFELRHLGKPVNPSKLFN